ncbi:melatonin receptor type 1B-A-like [Patiria miniata]|uniref:G-protein coupled receptors family 1 profile domain-containing protein n=1 Tax=Patiria miniata TaxID=46514 RepID=A0A913YYS5_PATMI|nr:melatonin receptor type 1B-A-like [Patiria miniata]
MDDEYDEIEYNSTDDSEEAFEFSDYTQRVIVAVLYLIIALLGIVGNTLVIQAVLLSRKLRTATNAFVVSLSVADLLTCLVVPWDAAAMLGMDGPPFGEWVCSVVAVVQSTTIGCSTYTLAAIGLQRLLLITRPVTTYQAIYSQRKIAACMVVTWLIPFLLTLLPPLFGVGEVGYNRKYHHCGFSSSHERSNDYDLIIAGGLYPLPLITIIVCYALIWRHLRRHAERVTSKAEEPADSATMNLSTVSESVATLRRSPTRQGSLDPARVKRSQNEITKNMFYIVCAFLLCLTPFAICLFYDDSDPFLPYAAAFLVFNSCVNPIIYATKHRDFKTVFRCILRRKWDSIPEPSDFLKAMRRKKCCNRGGLYA